MLVVALASSWGCGGGEDEKVGDGRVALMADGTPHMDDRGYSTGFWKIGEVTPFASLMIHARPGGPFSMLLQRSPSNPGNEGVLTGTYHCSVEQAAAKTPSTLARLTFVVGGTEYAANDQRGSCQVEVEEAGGFRQRMKGRFTGTLVDKGGRKLAVAGGSFDVLVEEGESQ